MDIITKKLDLPIPHFKTGKVREMYEFGEHFLMVATDRISAFDYVLPIGIPYKGATLTQISLFWFDLIKDIISNHVVESDFFKFPENLKQFPELEKRSIIVKKAEPLPIECVVRGYLSGSGWKEYQQTESVCGIELKSGMKESDKLPEPIFTPATKEEFGKHDLNISFEQTAEIVGLETATFLKETSIKIYKKAAEYALSRGIIIADTKFEFGKIGNQLILIDEILTPDSSRFWPQNLYEPGKSQPSFDKQYVRDYLLSINWNKQPPVPILPDNVVQETSKKYLEAFEKLTGAKLI